jgi:beta-glucanase (GH16 family)
VTFISNTYKLESGNFTDDFHTFALEWKEGVVGWYVDGKLGQTQTKWDSNGGKFSAPFDQEFHMVLNLAIGGGFVGYADASTKFPREFLIDYVRVHQK